MPSSAHTCPLCGGVHPDTERFCAECGSRLLIVETAGLQRSRQTQFTLPDYLLTARAREAAERKRRLAIDEGSGSGFAWIGAAVAAGAVLLSPLSGIGAGLFLAGLGMLLFGFWRMRQDAHAFNIAGTGVSIVSVIVLGAVLAQVVTLPAALDRRAPVASLPTATPDPREMSPIPPPPLAEGVPMLGANPARTGVQPGPAPAGRPERAWRVYTGGEVYASPIVEQGLVFIGVKGGQLLALDARTGEERWRADLGDEIVRATPAYSDGTLFVPAGTTLHAVDAATGKERWRLPIRFAGPSSPVVSGEMLYVATQEGQLYAVDTSAGRERWHFSADGLISCPPTLAAGTLFVGDDTGKVYALDAESGHERWRATVGGDILAAPTVGLGRVFVSTMTPSLVALDAESGHQRWQVPMGGDSSPAFTGSTVVVGSTTNGVYAIDAASGRTRWIFPSGSPVASSPVVSGGTVLVGSGDTLYALDAQTGAPAWGYPTGGPVDGAAAVTGGYAYFGSRDGYLYAVRGAER